MTQKFLVLQHVDVEHPGIFRDCMRDEGIDWDTVELDQGAALPAPDAYAALVVMGGPMDVWQEEAFPWLIAEKRYIADWVATRQKPFLGVCLGHQLLASALGGEVGPAQQAEVGVMPVALTADGAADAFFADCPQQFECLQWHGAEVRSAPPGARVLAASPLTAVQALGIGRHAYSFQFHVEAIASTVDDWAAIPEYRASLETELGANGVAILRAGVADNLADFNALAATIYRNWRALSA